MELVIFTSFLLCYREDCDYFKPALFLQESRTISWKCICNWRRHCCKACQCEYLRFLKKFCKDVLHNFKKKVEHSFLFSGNSIYLLFKACPEIQKEIVRELKGNDYTKRREGIRFRVGEEAPKNWYLPVLYIFIWMHNGIRWLQIYGWSDEKYRTMLHMWRSTPLPISSQKNGEHECIDDHIENSHHMWVRNAVVVFQAPGTWNISTCKYLRGNICNSFTMEMLDIPSYLYYYFNG